MADIKVESQDAPAKSAAKPGARSRAKDASTSKRKCVSTACVACRRRKSKCDGNLPSCAACASVYGTECVYDPSSDQRRKGVYRKGLDAAKTQDATLRLLVEGILNYPENEVMELVKQIRTCESLEDVAQSIQSRNAQTEEDDDDLSTLLSDTPYQAPPRFETELSGKIGGLRLESGAMQFVGGTSNLLYVEDELENSFSDSEDGPYTSQEEAIRSWTSVTKDANLILHLLNMYFTWHYPYFTTLSRTLFFRDFLKGQPSSSSPSRTLYCTPLLVNAMLTLGCHFTSWPGARAEPNDSATAGDQFFRECKAIIIQNDEYEHARTVTVQALALMSVREAGCGREAKGWIYSGMSFRMAVDLGLPYESSNANLSDEEADARRVTFWGCYLFDKCWSNYLGRPPQLALENITMKKFDVFPQEDAEVWAPWTDSGISQTHAQPARTRAIAIQISSLCEISSDLLLSFYRPNQVEKPLGKQAELKKLSELHTRLESWRRNLPKELEAKEGQLPQVLIMHMFFYLLFIHLFRPFLKYTQANSPLPAHVSPRRHCTQAAAAISKLLRLYKKTYGLRQICNIAVYIAHSACTIHLLNLQDKDSRRDLAHGLKHLEEIAECWLCARRTLNILQHQIRKWEIVLPQEAQDTLHRADAKFQFSRMKSDGRSDGGSPAADMVSSTTATLSQPVNPELGQTPGQQAIAHGGQMGKTQATSSQPGPQSQHTSRIRSSSSAQRAELLRQMQQNSLQAHTNQSQQMSQFPGTVPAFPGWDVDIWSLRKSEQGQKGSFPPELAPSAVANGASATQAVASPTAMFSGPHQTSALAERDWWLRDQSALFDNWTRRDSMSASARAAGSMAAGPATNAPAAGFLGTEIYSGLADAQLTAEMDAFGRVGNVAMDAGWSNYDLLSNGNSGTDVAALDFRHHNNGMS